VLYGKVATARWMFSQENFSPVHKLDWLMGLLTGYWVHTM